MKRGYIRLLIFELVVISILFICLINNLLIKNPYYKIIFLLLVGLLFKILFGFEKERHYLTKNICLEISICLLFYFFLYYLFGLIISFSKTQNYWNSSGIVNIIIPFIFQIVFQEILRYMILRKCEGSKLLIIITCILFIIFDLAITINLSSEIFIYIAIILFPIISQNIFCTYTSYMCGYKPLLLYLFIKKLYIYFVPIVPNPNEYIYSIIELVFPLICMYKLYGLFTKEKDNYIPREYHKKGISSLFISSLLTIILVYFTSGYFYYHVIVIATGSMTPNILKGDVVVIEKIKNKKDIEIGKVIAYKYNQIIIVHRLVNKINVNNSTYFYTKGDNNNEMDNYKIDEEMVIGIVNVRIPYIGYPTIMINELMNT